MDKGSDNEPRVNMFELTVEELRQDLKLTAEQEPIWQSYVDKVRALAGDVTRERSRRPAPGSVPQQIDRIVGEGALCEADAGAAAGCGPATRQSDGDAAGGERRA
jgi:hypothetical protein